MFYLIKAYLSLKYSIVLPKNFVEEIMKWYPGLHLDIDFFPKGAPMPPQDRSCFRIIKANNLWVDNKEHMDALNQQIVDHNFKQTRQPTQKQKSLSV